MSEQKPLTKTALLAAWDDLHTYLYMLSEAQLTETTDAAGWTVKDHVIHLAVWEDSLNAFLLKQSRPDRMGVDRATWEGGEINRINDVIYRRNRDLSWAQVAQWFQQAHEELIGRIQALTDEDLQRPYHYYQPESTASDLAAMRIGFATYSHYTRHMPWMRAIAGSTANG